MEHHKKARFEEQGQLPGSRQEVIDLCSDSDAEGVPELPRVFKKSAPVPPSHLASRELHHEPQLFHSPQTTNIHRQTSILDFAVKATMADIRSQQNRITEAYGINPSEDIDRKKRQDDMRKEKKRQQGRLRQQHFRKRERNKKLKTAGGAGKKSKNVLLGQVSTAASTSTSDLAEVSRPHGQAWKKKRTGKNGGVLQKRHQRINWYHPFLWTHIARVAPRVSWSPKFIVGDTKTAVSRSFLVTSSRYSVKVAVKKQP